MIKNKRFVNKGKDIFQYGEWWCSAGGEHCADVIATAINELIEENEQLKSENRLLYSRNTDLKRKNELYDAENEQLKKEVETLQEELAHFTGDCE